MKLPFYLLLCIFLAPAASARQAAAQTSPPDVLLITIDTLRADHVHCYGYDGLETPALDSVAKDGLRFDAAFTPSPLTNSSHASILTGVLPSAHGVTEFGAPLNARHRTLAEVLSQHGYRTAAFIGAIVLDSKSLAPGFDRGFDYYDNFPSAPVSDGSTSDVSDSAKTPRWGRVERRGMDVVQRAESWMSAHRGGPRFVWVHLYDPHDPYEPPAPFAQKYKEHLYDGEIAYADSALQHFLSYLKKRNSYRNSLVIVAGDHGEGLGEHQEDTHGIFLYDSTTHVPLIVKLPGERHANRVVQAQVRTTDILPTVLAVLNLPEEKNLDGLSLQPFFAGAEPSSRIAFAETDYPLSFGWAPLRSVRDGNFKFIEAPRPELYDLQNDPKELHTRYEPWNAAVLEFRKQLAGQRAKNPLKERLSAGAVGAGTADELRALGYLGPADALSSSNVPEPSLLPDPKDKIVEQNLLHAAMLAIDTSRTADARALLEKVLQTDENSFTALSQLGNVELGAKHFAAAAGHLKRASELRPQDSSTLFRYAQALHFSGDDRGASEALQSSLKINPGQYEARLLLGEIYWGSRELVKAQDQLEAALLLRTTFEAEMKLSEVLLARGKTLEAEAAKNRAEVLRRAPIPSSPTRKTQY